MPRMTRGAGADGAVFVGPAHGVALLAAAYHRGAALGVHKWMRRSPRSAGLVGLREIHLLRSQALLAIDGAPRRRRVTTAQEFLVDGLMALPAIACGEVFGNHEAVMIFLLLVLGGLMAVEAIHTLGGVGRHLVLMHNRILQPCVSLGTLA